MALDYNPYLVAAPRRRARPATPSGCCAGMARWTPSTSPTARRLRRPLRSSRRGARSSNGPICRATSTGWTSSWTSSTSTSRCSIGAALEAGFDGPISMLFPYLQPLQAAKFAAFARQRLPNLELTNECYVSLFSATQSTEQKVAHVIATHEAYHMWRGPGPGACLQHGAPGFQQLVHQLGSDGAAVRGDPGPCRARVQHLHACRRRESARVRAGDRS